MNCQAVRKSISEFLDQRLSGEDRTRLVEHLGRCRECSAYHEEISQSRNALRSLPVAAVPDRLRTELQVLASRERVRWNANRTLPLAFRAWIRSLQFSAENMMRPLALPLAGGVLSALFLFSVLVPTLGFKPSVGNDVPIRLYTPATLVELAPFAMNNDETVVELYIDDRGQATDYAVQRGKMSAEMQADVTKMMFQSRFTPATAFGQPTNGRVVITFRRINYIVRG